jgi:hypothetical protein
MHCSSFQRRGFGLAGLVLLVLTQGGCTNEIWRAAAQDTRHYWGMPGVVQSDSKGGTQLVLLYDWPGQTHVLLPLDSQGAPPSLFVYTGKGKTVAAIAADLPPQKYAAIRDYVFDEKSKAEARRAMNSARYTPFTYQRESQDSGYWHYASHLDLVMVALGPDGVPRTAKEIKTSDGQTDYLFPDGCRIIILPDHQPRTPGELRSSKALAVILTPLTVASDIILIPIAFIVRMATGDMC